VNETTRAGTAAPSSETWRARVERYIAARGARRQRLVKLLWQSGPRLVFEALIAVEAGEPLDAVLEGITAVSPGIYRAIGAEVLPIDNISVIEGGAR